MKNIKWHMCRIDYIDYVDADERTLRNCYLWLGMHLGVVKQRLVRRGFSPSQAERMVRQRMEDYTDCWGPERTQEPGHHRLPKEEPEGLGW